MPDHRIYTGDSSQIFSTPAPNHTFPSLPAPKRGPKPTPLPTTLTNLLKYTEDFFINPQYASAFTAAEYLIPHFMEALTTHLAEPDHPSSLTFLTTLRSNIFSELQFRAKLAMQPRVPWSLRQRGWDLCFGDQVQIVALLLAYRVETGQTDLPYHEGLMEHLAKLSEKGCRPPKDLRSGALEVLEEHDFVSRYRR